MKMASRFISDFHDDQYGENNRDGVASRGISLLRAPVRQDDFKKYLDYQPESLERDGLSTTHYVNKRNIKPWVDRFHPEAGNQLLFHPEARNQLLNNSIEPYTGNHIHLNRDNIFTRSFSQPDDRSDEFINERALLESSLALNRSFSQPQRREDINKAIHEELMNNPWGTYRRTPKKRDRYAIYIPDTECNEEQFQSDVYKSNIDLRIKDRRESYDLDKNYCTDSVYATYRRAPRTFPRLDVAVDRHDKATRDTHYHGGVTRDTRRDGLVLSNLSKIPNDAIHSMNNSLVTRNNARGALEKQDSVQHLFPVPLNDVKLVNKSQNETFGEKINQTGILNKRIKNNLSDDKGLNGFLKRKCRGTRNSMATGSSKKDDEKKPFFYCRWVTEFPKTLFLLTLGGHILIALVTVVLLFSSYDLFPTEFEFLPMYDLKVPWLKRDFAWRFRHEYKGRYIRKWYIQGLNKWYRSMAYDRANIVIYYDTGGGNIFTKENLKHMEAVEHELASMRNYSDFCEQSILLKCKKFTSVLRYFDGTYADIDPIFNDTDYNNIAEVLYTAKTNKATKGDFAYFLTKDYHVTKKHASAERTRTLIPMGFPFKLGQSREAMEDAMEGFLATHFKPTIKKLQESTPELKLIYWSFLLFKHDIVKQIFYDMALAVGSITFIFGFIVYHTKSMWISTFAVASILTSFLCTNIIYRVVLDFRYFGFFHVITLFIILGIGADDLFVFLDVWKSTEFESHPSLAHRLSSAYKRSMKSMFFTSLTTTVAFFVSAFSPLLATKSFGVFAGLLVIVNYMSVVVYFPTVVILHHLYFKTWEWPCISYISKRITDFKSVKFERKENTLKENKPPANTIQTIFDDNSVIGSAGNRYNVVGMTNAAFNADIEDEYGFIKFTTKSSIGPYPTVNEETAVKRDSVDSGVTSTTSWHTTDGQKQKKLLVRFFRDYYFKFVTHWLIKWIILVVLSTLVVFFMYCISTIETDNEPAQFYRNSHNYGKALDLDFHGFVANKNDRNVVVYIVWGLKERDMSACHFSDARCIGVERFDDSFNPNSQEAQLAVQNFCKKLHSFDDLDIEHFRIRRDFSTGKPEIKCFATEMDRWFQKEGVQTGENLTLPWNYRKAITFMQSRNLMYNTLKFNETFPNVYEIPVSYWLNDGYKFKERETFDKFQSLIGEATSYYSTPLKTDFSVFYGNRLMYLGVQVNLTLGRFSSGYPEGKPVMDRWETFVQNEVNAMPPGMQNGFQLTKDYWHNLSVQKTLEDSAIIGVVVGILLAFPILTIATQNILIGFFATLSICCSTICVVGIIPLTGKLGVLEALNMCMVVGLTVDYVVHLAEGYHMSKRDDRKSRVQDMLEIMGISVFSGACTTLGASVFMFFAQIQFIIRFGMFMFSTIGFSLLYSLAFFTTIMGILGPNGNQGDIKVICNHVANKCRRLHRKT